MTKLKSRTLWQFIFLLTSITAFGMLLAALFFEYAMDLKPCVKCVYQRLAVLLVGCGSLGMFFYIRMRKRYRRTLAWLLGMSGSLYGIHYASSHVSLQSDPFAFLNPCDAFPIFPFNLPLDSWLPFLFKANGPCGDVDWVFLGLSMPAWVNVFMHGFFLVFLGYALFLSFKYRSNFR